MRKGGRSDLAWPDETRPQRIHLGTSASTAIKGAELTDGRGASALRMVTPFTGRAAAVDTAGRGQPKLSPVFDSRNSAITEERISFELKALVRLHVSYCRVCLKGRRRSAPNSWPPLAR